MSELEKPPPSEGLHLNDIARLPEQLEAVRWRRAKQIFNRSRLGDLSSEYMGESHYLMTPKYTVEVDGVKNSYRLAILMNGDDMTNDLYMVINDVMPGMIRFGQYGEGEMLSLAELRPVLTDGVDIVLTAIEKNLAKSIAKKKSDREGLIVGWGFITVLIVLVIIAASCMSQSSRDRQQALDNFDAKNVVLSGQRFDFNSNGIVSSDKTNMTPDVPWGGDVQRHARSIDLDVGSCASLDYLPETDYLIVETNAPAKMLTVSVDDHGLVKMCMADPYNQGDRKYPPDYRINFQSQPK